MTEDILFIEVTGLPIKDDIVDTNGVDVSTEVEPIRSEICSQSVEALDGENLIALQSF